MLALHRHGWSILSWTVAGIVLVVAGMLLFAWSGIYSVAASSGHFDATRWLLEFGMRNSVRTHSSGMQEPSPRQLDDPDLVRLGTGHFHTVCATCHAAPGATPSPTLRAAMPAPPPLQDRIGEWRDRELFWIVKHGIKYTGMPAWPTLERDDEVWAMVAFLRKLPAIDAALYRRLALGNAEAARGSPPETSASGAGEDVATACSRCHDYGDQPQVSDLVPRLSGQRATYLANALHAYAKGTRASGVMQEVASRLEASDIDGLARHYASLAPAPTPTPVEQPAADMVERGETIATRGIVGQHVPPCLSCHGASASESYPLLAGQPRAYLEIQLKLWRAGRRSSTAQARLMEDVARRLTDLQISDVAAYFSAAQMPASASRGAAVRQQAAPETQP